MDKTLGRKRYGWQLVKKGKPEGQVYTEVYLDSPLSDTNIFGSEGNIHCLPVTREVDGKLSCLLLQLAEKETGTYRRIGVTKLSAYQTGPEKVLARLDEAEEASLPCYR